MTIYSNGVTAKQAVLDTRGRQKVLYLVPDFIGPPGGIARYCRLVCRALAEQQAQATVLALMDAAGSCVDPDVLPHTAYYPFAGKRQNFVQHAFLAALTQSVDLILVGHPNFAPLGWALSQIARVPFLTFVYGIEVWRPMPILRRWALQQSKQVIAISHFTADKAIMNNGLAAHRMRVLHNCLDPEFTESGAASSHSGNLSLLTVARLSRSERYKGQDIVIQCLPHLLPLFPDLCYDIVGDGDWRPELEQLAATLQVRHAVHFHGQVSDVELKQRYATATLYVMPSRGEGFGFVFLEAMANCLPIVAGNLDATTEVVVHDRNGILVNPNSVHETGQAIVRLLNNPSLAHSMALAGQERVTALFTFVSFQTKLNTYLSELQHT